mmetsp:Transcript_3659/g.6966  ORF Transcript_3659/g.6966 Transcript_3659/m.6966 type:complete len:355 (-) Transcript_3659:2223-3287(-)
MEGSVAEAKRTSSVSSTIPRTEKVHWERKDSPSSVIDGAKTPYDVLWLAPGTDLEEKPGMDVAKPGMKMGRSISMKLMRRSSKSQAAPFERSKSVNHGHDRHEHEALPKSMQWEWSKVQVDPKELAHVVCYLMDNVIRRELVDLNRILRAMRDRKFYLGKFEAEHFGTWFRDTAELVVGHIQSEQSTLFRMLESRPSLSIALPLGLEKTLKSIILVANEVLEIEKLFFDATRNMPYGQLLTRIEIKCQEFQRRTLDYFAEKEVALLPLYRKISTPVLRGSFRSYFRLLARSSPVGSGFLLLTRKEVTKDVVQGLRDCIFPGAGYILRSQLRNRWFAKRAWTVETMEYMSTRLVA